jgi:triacylglycerol lipase
LGAVILLQDEESIAPADEDPTSTCNPSVEGAMDRVSAAENALLIMYAFDMCEANPSNLAPAPDPRIGFAGFNVVGHLYASDAILRTGLSLRRRMFGSSTDAKNQVCYGYVASHANGEFVAVIRGTHGLLEWADDIDFLMMHPPGRPSVLVDQGFWEIYETLTYQPLAPGAPPVKAAQGLANIAPAGNLTVLGHSLGAALATYLTLDLAGSQANGCFFASPRTGNKKYVDLFEQQNINYDLWNYALDKVPTVPIADPVHLSNYAPLAQEKTIPADGGLNVSIENTLPCFHHLICYTALLDPPTYKAAMIVANQLQVQDDISCAKCVLSTGTAGPN